MADSEPQETERKQQDEEEEEEEEDDEELDPRVQGELETLNAASDDINTLEVELEKSRNKFRAILSHSTQRLNILFKKLGKCVLKARPYYELLAQSRQSQAEAQKSAANFQRANSIYQAAREMVQLAEERNFPPEDETKFDSAWQEMLNHATIKFMDAKREKNKSEGDHLLKAAEYAAIQQKLRFYEKDMHRTIPKAKPYFELKHALEKHLQVERMNVEDLQMGLVCAKQKYRSALNSLEAISEEIHQKRHKRLHLPPRTPGVGAESDMMSLPSIQLDNLSDTACFLSLDDLDADGASSIEEGTLSPSQSGSNLAKLGDMKAEVGERDNVAEGSESISPTDLQEEPLSPEQKASYSGISGPLPSGNIGVFPPNSAPNSTFPAQSVASPPATPNHGKNPIVDVTKSPSRRQQQKMQTQMSFPILQHLKDSQRQMNPSFPRSNRRSQSPKAQTSQEQNSPNPAQKKSDEVFV